MVARVQSSEDTNQVYYIYNVYYTPTFVGWRGTAGFHSTYFPHALPTYKPTKVGKSLVMTFLLRKSSVKRRQSNIRQNQKTVSTSSLR